MTFVHLGIIMMPFLAMIWIHISYVNKIDGLLSKLNKSLNENIKLKSDIDSLRTIYFGYKSAYDYDVKELQKKVQAMHESQLRISENQREIDEAYPHIKRRVRVKQISKKLAEFST